MKKIHLLLFLILPVFAYGQGYTDTLRYHGTFKKQYLEFKIFPDYQHYSLSYSAPKSYRLVSGALNSLRGYKNDPDATLWELTYTKLEKEPLNFVRLSHKKGLFILDRHSRIIGWLEEY